MIVVSPYHRAVVALTATAALCLAGSHLRAEESAKVTEYVARVRSVKLINPRPDTYRGWADLERLRDGTLVLGYSGNREGHVDPFGRAEYMLSRDNGNTWSKPRILADTTRDERDAALVQTRSGALLFFWFESCVWLNDLARIEEKGISALDPESWLMRAGGGDWNKTKLRRWQKARAAVPAEYRNGQYHQAWMRRSINGGRTWSKAVKVPVHTPGGPILLADGSLVSFGMPGFNVAYRSLDEGLTWRRSGEIPVRQGDKGDLYCEIHGVQASDGRIIIHIRNENQADSYEILQSESADGGRTWSAPHLVGLGHGVPMKLLRLQDGGILTTYGYRLKPFGIRASLSTDNGNTWSRPMVITDDGWNDDLGYPATVQLADGSLLTAWYEMMKGNKNCQLRQAYWSIAHSGE